MGNALLSIGGLFGFSCYKLCSFLLSFLYSLDHANRYLDFPWSLDETRGKFIAFKLYTYMYITYNFEKCELIVELIVVKDDYYLNADGLKSWEEFLKSVTEAKDLLLSETIQQQRLDRENNLKLRDTLKLRFGEHMMHTPNMAVFEWTDVPLKGSSCIPYKAPFVDYLDVKRCPGSHLTGVMVLTESNPRDSFSLFDFSADDISGQKSNVTSDSFLGASANQWFENETNLKKSSRSINVIEKEVEIETKKEPKSDQSHYKDDEISMRSTKNLINITSERKSKSSKTALSAGNLNFDRTLGLLKLKLSAIRLKRKRFKKDLSPFFVVFVENDNASSYSTKNRFNDEVYRSKVIKETRNPVWDVAPISLVSPI